MSETITASLTVSGGDVITAEINTLARGPAGPTGASGASTWDDITGTASDVPFLPVAAPAHSEGLVFYDSTDKSLTYYNDEADVSMNIGRELWVRVRNDSGSPILNGKVAYINDAVGQLPTIRLARADSAVTSRVIGIATHDIGNNEFGYVTTSGEVKGLATNAYQDGDLLFLSAVTAGEMTTTAPLAPNRVIQVATVLHAHPTQGKLYCHPETDSIPSTGIVDSTATGRALITTANASAARTTLELAAAATASTPNTLVLRDNTGGASFVGVDVTTLTAAGISSDGLVSFNGTDAGDSLTFNMVNYAYGTGAASAHRTALGSGATGDALFTAANLTSVRSTIERRVFVKPTDTTKNADATPAADPYFQNIPVSAGVYRIYVELMGTTNSTFGLLPRLAHPANSRSAAYIPAFFYGSAVQSVSIAATGTTTSLGNMTANGTRAIHGFLDYTFASSGNIAIEWAQNTSGAFNTILHAGSYLIIEKLS